METNKDFLLGDDEYYQKIYPKSQIVIGNTNYSGMKHVEYWKGKLNGSYKGTAPYTIGIDGTIYEHYDPKWCSDIMNMGDLDKHLIPILLENEGWLTKNYNTGNLLTWSGDIYNKPDVSNIKWRGKMRWVPYTDEQLESLVILADYLLNEFSIKRFVSEHNTKIDDIAEKNGIYYKSNYNINYLDVSPAFKFKDFKTKIEDNGKLE